MGFLDFIYTDRTIQQLKNCREYAVDQEPGGRRQYHGIRCNCKKRNGATKWTK
jgi:hypothetical protein